MSRRAASPAPSEAEVDILGSLFTDDVETTNGRHKKGSGGNGGFNFDDAEGIFNDLEDDQNYAEDDGDEAFIALQQAASFRKASNLKGKSVKKGGGFQAMGMSALRDIYINIYALDTFYLWLILIIQVSMRIFSRRSRGKASPSRRRSRGKPYLSSSTGKMSWAWPGLDPERRQLS